MTKNEFISECEKLLIDVDIALENNGIKKALLKRDNKKVLELLKEY